MPGRCHQEIRRRNCRQLAEAPLHRVFQLRAGVSVWHTEADSAVRADDEVRYVLRPHVGWQAPHVRDRLSQPGVGLRNAGDDCGGAPRETREYLLVWESED